MIDTKSDKKLLNIAFSGGSTSAFMTKWILENKSNEWDEIVVTFANTGQEHEKTLEFVNKCDIDFNFNVVWLEADVVHEKRKGTKHKIVDYQNCSRKGEPYEEVIKKYGIPNNAYPHCTRELKLQPIKSYLRSIGWKKDSYYTAIGIRIDEVDRINSKMNELKLWYPLCEDVKVTKGDIRDFWDKQSFKLGLDEHYGNCVWCWKKNKRKLMTLALSDPKIFEFPKKMESLYSTNGANGEYEGGRVFFRNKQSTSDLLHDATTTSFTKFDQSQVNWGDCYKYDDSLDKANGCSESCEVY